MTRKLEDEIRNALLPGAPDPQTREAWAKAAMERTAAPRRRRLHPQWPVRLALVAAALLAVILWPRETETHKPPVRHAGSGDENEAARGLRSMSVDEQRVANAKALKDAAFGDVRKGNWVIVVAGAAPHVAKTLEEGLGWADKLYPEAKHRFLVPISNDDLPQGDVVVDRSPVALGSAGSWFLQSVGIEAKGLKELKLDVGGKKMTIRVDPESMAPLILPAGVRFPRFEMQGRMILEDMDRNWRTFRRYFTRVRCANPKIDQWCEAIGAESTDKYAPGNWLAVRLGGNVFHALRRTPAEQAAEEREPMVVLRFKEGSTGYLNELFERVEVEGVSQFAVPRAKETVLERYDPQGVLVGKLSLPDAKAATAKALQEFLRKK